MLDLKLIHEPPFLPGAIIGQGKNTMQWQKEKYLITTDTDKVDIDVIHQYLSEQSYWAMGIPRETVARSVQHSICF